MTDQPSQSYFRGLAIKLSIPVLAGAGVLFLYYWKLLHLHGEAIQKTIYFVMTGKGRMEDRDTSIRLGAEEFLTKPLELRDIITQIKRYFGAAT